MNIVEHLPPLADLGFGKYFAPEMILARYEKNQWHPWKKVSVHDFHLAPTAKVLHYAQEIFEGLKVFRSASGSMALFRPEENIKRMTRSAEILAMPPYPEKEYLESMRVLSRACAHLIPEEPGALYLRPTMIATDSTLGVAPSTEYLFYILASPVGGYFGATKSDVPACVSILATKDYVRACPGGLGAAKTGANYAASLLAVSEAKKKGFQNVLFLDAIQHQNLEELSGMNIFIVDKGVLKTPKLGDTILAGITRDSLLQLAKAEGIAVQETDIGIDALMTGLKSGQITEVFACGTGASVTAVTELGWKGEKHPVGDKHPGPLTTRLYRSLLDIQTQRKPGLKPDWLVQI